LFKLGKRLAVGEVGIRSDGDEDLVAHVTATTRYPPRTPNGNIIPLSQAIEK